MCIGVLISWKKSVNFQTCSPCPQFSTGNEVIFSPCSPCLQFSTGYGAFSSLVPHVCIFQQATDSTEACLKDVLVHYYEGPFKSDIVTFSGAWDFLHRYYRCCGVEGGDVFDSMVNWDRTWIEKYEDTFFNTSFKLKEFKVITLLPYTCCVFKVGYSARSY